MIRDRWDVDVTMRRTDAGWIEARSDRWPGLVGRARSADRAIQALYDEASTFGCAALKSLENRS